MEEIWCENGCSFVKFQLNWVNRYTMVPWQHTPTHIKLILGLGILGCVINQNTWKCGHFVQILQNKTQSDSHTGIDRYSQPFWNYSKLFVDFGFWLILTYGPGTYGPGPESCTQPSKLRFRFKMADCKYSLWSSNIQYAYCIT